MSSINSEDRVAVGGGGMKSGIAASPPPPGLFTTWTPTPITGSMAAARRGQLVGSSAGAVGHDHGERPLGEALGLGQLLLGRGAPGGAEREDAGETGEGTVAKPPHGLVSLPLVRRDATGSLLFDFASERAYRTRGADAKVGKPCCVSPRARSRASARAARSGPGWWRRAPADRRSAAPARSFSGSAGRRRTAPPRGG